MKRILFSKGQVVMVKSEHQHNPEFLEFPVKLTSVAVLYNDEEPSYRAGDRGYHQSELRKLTKQEAQGKKRK